MLNMDEHDSADVLGVDEETESEVADRSRQATSYANQAVSRVSDAPPCATTYAERLMDAPDKKPSLLGRLQSKQALVNEQKVQNTQQKKHEQSR